MATPRNRKHPYTPLSQPKRAVIYLRMSQDRAGEGAGLARQEEACRALCLARGWDVVDVVDDTISAIKHRLDDRDGWQRVIKMIETGDTHVVVAWHLDRVTRSMKDLEELIDLAVNYGVGLATAAGDIDLTTDVGRMVARILAAVAAAEGERKAARQILANEQRASKGHPMWVRRPFGYEKDGTLRADEAKLVHDAYEDLLKGKSIGSVYRSWNAAGYRTTAPIPREWDHHAFRVLILSARNAGILVRLGEEVGPGNWAAITGQPTFRAVQRLLADPSRRRGTPPDQRYLLTGMAVCDVCDGPVRSRNVQWGAYDKIYCCRKGHVSLPMEWADGVVLRRLVEEAVNRGQATFGYDEGAAYIDVAPLKERQRQIGDLLTELGEDRAAGLISREEQIAASKKLRGELEQIESQLMAADKAARWDYVDVAHLYEEFDGFDVERQRELTDQAFSAIRIKIRQFGSRHRAYKDGLPSSLIETIPS